jgi:hypothetical protein
MPAKMFVPLLLVLGTVLVVIGIDGIVTVGVVIA